MGVMPMARSILLPLLALAVPAAAAEITVHATRDGEVLEVVAVAEFEGNITRTWQVLTDYGRIAEFVPSMEMSRIVSRERNSAVVEQKGEARMLFFSYPINLRLAVTEYPYERIESRAIGGNFRELRGAYALEAREGRIKLRYTGRLVPDFFIPPLIGTLVLRRNVEETFRAMVNEIERRHREPAKPEKRDP
ncbi:MAG: hypothetical protein A3I02_16155 [Betaproteobacteria bacterium RIFCSPLOWO2_02_FULL_67_26]|nr:MAG: hypothetical protein A3I02_16155 [Betaproteobacteria bacterium RIFCSPLOWO2_02_FULL_67_26]